MATELGITGGGVLGRWLARPLVRDLIAVLAVLVAIALYWPLKSSLFPLLLAAVVFASWSGGIRSALLATLVAVAASWAVFTRAHGGGMPQAEELARMGMFLALAFLVGALCAGLRSQTLSASALALKRAASERRFALVLEGANDGIWDWDLTTGTTFFSTRFRELTGFTDESDEEVADTIAGLVHPDDRDHLMGALRAHLERRGPFDLECRLMCAGNEVRWFQTRAQAVWDAEGRATRIAGAIRDITHQKEAEDELRAARDELELRVQTRTGELEHANEALRAQIAERVQAEEALRESHNLVDALFETSNDAIFIKDPEGRYLAINPAGARVFDRTPAEILGRTDHELFPPQTADIVMSNDRRVLETGQALSFEISYETAEGTRYSHALKSLYRDARGRPAGIFGISRDVSDRKMAEQALQQAHDQLEARVRERTLQLAAANQALQAEIAERRKAEAALLERARAAALEADISAALATGDDMRSVLQRCAEAMVDHLGAAFARIWTLTEPQQVLELRASAGLYTHLDGFHSRVAVGKLKIGRIAQTHQPHLTNDLVNDPHVGDPEWARQEGLIAFAGYPLVVADRVVGVMAAFSHEAFSDSTLQVLASVTDGIAQFIERKRAWDAAREIESRLQAILDHSPAVVHLKDLNGRYLLVNRRFESLFQLEDQQIVGRTAHDLFAPELAASIDANDQRVLAAGRPLQVEDFVPQPDGPHTFLSIKAPIKDASGTTSGICTVATDITERKRSMEALRASEERFRLLFERNLAGAIRLSEDGSIIDSNAAFARILGLQSAHLTRDLTFPELFVDSAAWRHVLASLRDHGAVDNHEFRLRRQDGSPGWFLGSLIRLGEDNQGRAVMQGTFLDITDRKQTEEALRESERLYRLMFENNPQPMWVFDAATFAFLAVNDAAVRHYGYSREEFLAMSIADIRPDEDRPRLLEWVTTDQGMMCGDAGIWRHRRKDGTLIDAHISATALTFLGHRARLVMANDVTERRRAEIALLRQNHELGVLNAVSSVLNGSLNLEELLDPLRDLLANQLPIEGGSIVLFHPTDHRPALRADWQLPAEVARELDELIGSTPVLGRVSRLAGAVPSQNDHEGSLWTFAIDCAPPSWQRGLCIPLTAKGRTLGILCLFGEAAAVTPTDKAAFFEVLGQQVGAAIQNARLFKQLRVSRKRLRALSRRLVAVQEAERRRIARELHDEIGQVLTGLKLTLEMASRGPIDERASRFENAQALVDRLLAQVRALSLDLRPTMLDDLGLLPALFWHLEHFAAQTGVHVDFQHASADRRFPPEVETAAYRIIQEALTNVARHAGVRSVTLRLWANAEALGLQVEDDGIGFDSGANGAGIASSGLSGMRERASLLRGRLSIESAPGSGTVIMAELPLHSVALKSRETTPP